jgi:hypothetical protein
MKKLVVQGPWFILFCFCLSLPLSAQESITLTTYYPSPFGVYNELRVKRVAIGESYFDSGAYPWDSAAGGLSGGIEEEADLVVEGKVRIGGLSSGSGTKFAIYDKDSLNPFGQKSATLSVANPRKQSYSSLALRAGFNPSGTIDANWAISSNAIDPSNPHFSVTEVFAAGGQSRIKVIPGGDVGIGVSTPQAKLDVGGGVKIGQTGLACSSDTKGTIRYNNSASSIQYCDGNNWSGIGGQPQTVILRRRENKDKYPLHIVSYTGSNPLAGGKPLSSIASAVDVNSGPSNLWGHKLWWFGIRCNESNGWRLTGNAHSSMFGTESDVYLNDNAVFAHYNDAKERNNYVDAICTRF